MQYSICRDEIYIKFFSKSNIALIETFLCTTVSRFKHNEINCVNSWLFSACLNTTFCDFALDRIFAIFFYGLRFNTALLRSFSFNLANLFIRVFSHPSQHHIFLHVQQCFFGILNSSNVRLYFWENHIIWSLRIRCFLTNQDIDLHLKSILSCMGTSWVAHRWS